MKRGFLISVGAYLGLWLVLEALFPAPSYAYLDPGTGNVLVYLAISLVGSTPPSAARAVLPEGHVNVG